MIMLVTSFHFFQVFYWKLLFFTMRKYAKVFDGFPFSAFYVYGSYVRVASLFL